MKTIECDTNMVQDMLDKVSDNITEYELLINRFFKKVGGISSTGEWVGNNADTYCRLTLLDKEMYMKYSDGIKEIVERTRNFIEDTESTIIENEKNCESGKYGGYY